MRHRSIHRIEALVALTAVAAACVAVAWSYALELKGPYVDLIASDIATRRLGVPVTVLDVRVRRWREIRFGLATATANDGVTLMACGSGRILFRDFPFLKGETMRAVVQLNDVALLESLYRRWSMASWAAGKAFQDPIFVKRLEVVFLGKEGYSEAHIRRFDSQEMMLAGGARWKGCKFLKANVFVLLPEVKFERVPKELRARLIKKGRGKKGFRVTYASGHLTAYGSKGPFFTARWATE